MKKPLKRLSAIIIMFCFFLPLSQCHSPDKSSNAPTVERLNTEYEDMKTNDYQIFNMSKLFKIEDLNSYLLLFLFFWPLALVVLQEQLSKYRENTFIILSTILCGLTIYAINQLLSFTTLLYGGYIWLVAMTIFTSISCLEFIQYVKNKI